MTNFNEMGKVELRVACKEHGVKNYGKMNNDAMRQALAHAVEMANLAADCPSELATYTVNADTFAETDNVAEPEVHPIPTSPFSIVGQLCCNKQEAEAERKPSRIEKNREERNGVKRPSAGGLCRSVWDALDGILEKTGNNPTAADVKKLAEENQWNPNNASIEFYAWRKFNGISGRQSKSAN